MSEEPSADARYIAQRLTEEAARIAQCLFVLILPIDVYVCWLLFGWWLLVPLALVGISLAAAYIRHRLKGGKNS